VWRGFFGGRGRSLSGAFGEKGVSWILQFPKDTMRVCEGYLRSREVERQEKGRVAFFWGSSLQREKRIY